MILAEWVFIKPPEEYFSHALVHVSNCAQDLFHSIYLELFQSADLVF